MSGLEIAGLSLAVLPIIIEVVKGYGTVAETFRLMKHYSQELDSINLQFRVQKAMFENECCLLLGLALDKDQDTQQMMRDPLHRLWNSSTVNRKLRDKLGSQVNLCEDIMAAILRIIEDFSNDLRCFDIFVSRAKKGETMKRAIARLRHSVTIAFEKTRYDKNINQLRDRTMDFKTLREQLVQLSAPQKYEPIKSKRKVLPNYDAIRVASGKLQDALRNAEWCESDQHRQHLAKLCIDVEIRDNVRLDLAISCQTEATQSRPARAEDPPIWLYVQNVTLLGSSKPAAEQEGIGADEFLAISGNERARCDQDSCSKTKKRRKVQFVETEANIACIQRRREGQEATVTCVGDAMINLCSKKNICRLFKKSMFAKMDLTKPGQCVGYLESPNRYRHLFYVVESHPKLQKHQNLELLSMPGLMSRLSDEGTSMVDQLEIARKATIAVLQYHSTPWLSSEWHLRDLSLFHSAGAVELSEGCMATLHLSARVSDGRRTISDNDTAMVSSDDTSQLSLEDQYGINNLPLFSLGVVLLQLGYWKPIEALKKHSDYNDVLTARRLAHQQTPLGPRYQRIVRKCLQCNFGFGNDLGREELQSAVYGDVVCELEEMIRALSL